MYKTKEEELKDIIECVHFNLEDAYNNYLIDNSYHNATRLDAMWEVADSIKNRILIANDKDYKKFCEFVQKIENETIWKNNKYSVRNDEEN